MPDWPGCVTQPLHTTYAVRPVRTVVGMVRRRLVAYAATAALAAGCASDPDPPTAERPRAEATASATPTPSAEPVPEPERVVVGRFTEPQLDLSPAQARRIVAGDLTRWRGRDVEVVRLDRVIPSQVVARVGGRDPVRDDPRAVSLTVVGDLMLTRGVPDAAAALRPMSRRLAAADLTVGNLESTLSTDGAPTQGGDSFGASPALLGPLRQAGLDAVSLANNHAGDYGDRALVETVRVLRESPVVPFGAGADRRDAERPAYLEVGRGSERVRFAFVGFNAIGETPRAQPGQPGAVSVRMPPRTGPLQQADLDRVTALVRRAARRADVVVALPHWGTQYTHVPEPVQRRVGAAVVRAGADLVVGGHPHWVQGIDAVPSGRGEPVPLLHSLGNFVFDMDFSEQTMQGVVLETTWWREAGAARLVAMRLVPYAMDPGSFAPRVVTGETARDILGDVASTSTGPYAAG